MKNKYTIENQFDTLGRATIIPSMKRVGSVASGKKRRRATKSKSSNSIRVVKGKVVLRVPGFQGVQRFSPSHLIHHINKKNLKSAAKNALKKTNNGNGKRRKKGNRKGKNARK